MTPSPLDQYQNPYTTVTFKSSISYLDFATSNDRCILECNQTSRHYNHGEHNNKMIEKIHVNFFFLQKGQNKIEEKLSQKITKLQKTCMERTY